MICGITFSINFPDRLNLIICNTYNAKFLVSPVFGFSASDDRERDLTRLGPFGSANSLASHLRPNGLPRALDSTISQESVPIKRPNGVYRNTNTNTKIDANTAKSASLKADVRELQPMLCLSREVNCREVDLPHPNHSSLSLSLFDRPSYQDSVV